MTDDFARARTALAKAAAMYRVIDDLDKRFILWDGVGQDLLEDSFQRTQPIMIELAAAAPELFGDAPYRPSMQYPVGWSRDMLRLLRRDLAYVLEIGAGAGLFDLSLLPSANPTRAVIAGGALESSTRKIIVGVVIAIISAALLVFFKLK